MSVPKTIGFPRMMKEPGEKRVFLPEFIQFIANMVVAVFIEEGYGSRLGLSFDDYRGGYENILMCNRDKAFQQDLVLLLRSPQLEEFQMLKSGGCLISMLHFPTRPKRVDVLKELGLYAISLDSIVNDNNLRLVENMRSVAWNGLEAAFDFLGERWPGLHRPDGEPIQALILGAGMVGKHAIEAATKLGNIERNNQHIQEKGAGSIALCAGRNISTNPEIMRKLFHRADILVDATQRRDTALPVVPNNWIAWLPEHTVITDLAVDPYTLDVDPPVVRGVEGIPQGSLDQYIFAPDDPHWMDTIPASIPVEQRRTTVSCYSWPGIHPEACMRYYAQQLKPLMEVLVQTGYQDLNPNGGFFERALYRGSLDYWVRHGHYGPRPR